MNQSKPFLHPILSVSEDETKYLCAVPDVQHYTKARKNPFAN